MLKTCVFECYKYFDIKTVSSEFALKVAIVGKTNVGKSTLFNLLVRKRMAIKHNKPGVTRDRQDEEATIAGRRYIFTDTAGLEYLAQEGGSRHIKQNLDHREVQKDAEMYQSMMKQSMLALELADAVLFVVDGVNGLTEEDMYFADLVRPFNKKTLTVVNKCESEKRISIDFKDLYRMGLGEPVAASAEHSQGLDSIMGFLMDCYDGVTEEGASSDSSALEAEDAPPPEEGVVSIAIVGRPNVGKSTLINAILHEDRMIVGDKSGITRDSVRIPATMAGRKVCLVDTAGIRKSSLKDELEELSVYETHRAIRLAQVVLIVLDASTPFLKQDLSIIGECIEEGRAVLIVVNKWDKVRGTDIATELSNAFQTHTSSMFSGIFKPNIVRISALKLEGIEEMQRKIFDLHEKWSCKITTSTLHKWLDVRQQIYPVPRYQGKTVKIKHIVQARIRPPTFVVFSNRPDGIKDTYRRYLANAIAKDFSLDGVPIRVEVKSSVDSERASTRRLKVGGKPRRRRI